MAEGGENSGHSTYPFYNGLYSPVDDAEEASAASMPGPSSINTATTVEVQLQLIPDENIHGNHLNHHINNIPSCSSGYSKIIPTPSTNHVADTTINATNSDNNIPKINQHYSNSHNSNNSNINSNNKNNNNFKCIICNLIYQNKLDYVLHVRQHHVGSEKYRCDLCVKVCTSYPALLRHKIMSHTSGKCT